MKKKKNQNPCIGELSEEEIKEEAKEENKEIFEFLKEALKDKVSNVIPSKRFYI